jgi:response regulator RpfG family c-di-GMP phosphodiesterase
VDDELDNLDLLYRTFRREFTVFRADSGMQALEILAQEGEMAAIISDQRMPEMKGTDFLKQTVSDFPDTVRIVLTGYTDLADLIDAINSGQVHKYVSKPWEPEQLKSMISEAAENYDLLKQRSQDLLRSQARNTLLSLIFKITENSNRLIDCLEPLAIALRENFGADEATLQLIDHSGLPEAIATAKSQVALMPELETNLAINITFRQQLIGILSLKWQNANAPSPNEIAIIQQCVDQLAIALTCLRLYEKL